MRITIITSDYPDLEIDLTISPYLLRIAREISSASGDSGSIERALSSFAISNIAAWSVAPKSDGSLSKGKS